MTDCAPLVFLFVVVLTLTLGRKRARCDDCPETKRSNH
jgi:hypothetical protein